jgi:hypothetical protein
MENPREWTMGAHVCRFEPPDLLWLEFRGRVSLEETVQLLELFRELGSARPFFLVSDVTGVPKLDAETQRYLGEHANPAWVRAIVVVGASLFHRAAARGVFIAAWLTGRADKSEVSKVHFASTPAEAAELVVQLRGRHGGKVA